MAALFLNGIAGGKGQDSTLRCSIAPQTSARAKGGSLSRCVTPLDHIQERNEKMHLR